MPQLFRQTALALLTSAALFASSCDSNDDDTPTPSPVPTPTPPATCRIVSAQDDNDIVTFSYDSQRRLISYTGSGNSTPVTRTYTYAPGYVISLYTSNSVTSSRDSIRLNSDGYVTSRTNVRLPDNTVQSVVTYQYGANNKLATASRQEANGNSNIFTYEYNTDGDLTKSLVDGVSNTTYEYYPDVPVRPGDVLFFTEKLQFGDAKVLSNTHLLKSQTNTMGTSQYTYEFDTQGRVTKVTTSDSSNVVGIMTVTQNCD